MTKTSVSRLYDVGDKVPYIQAGQFGYDEITEVHRFDVDDPELSSYQMAGGDYVTGWEIQQGRAWNDKLKLKVTDGWPIGDWIVLGITTGMFIGLCLYAYMHHLF